MKLRRHACAGVLLLACNSSGGSETGNPVVATHMGLSLRSGDPDRIAIGQESNGVLLQHAWLAFGQVTFLTDDDCARFGDIDIVGPTKLAADLTREGTELALRVPARGYCGVAVPLNRSTKALPASAPPELADHSIVLSGERADGQPFTLMHSEQDTLELAAADGDIEIAAGGPELLLSFDVAVWMNGIDLDAVQPQDDGVIHIDVEHNRALLDVYEANLECSLELFADEDEDGEVGLHEASLAHCTND